MNLRLFDSDVVARVTNAAPSDTGIEDFLATNITAQSVGVTLMWTEDIVIEIALIHVRISDGGGSGKWQNVLPQRWQDGDGEYSQQIGVFPSGSTIEVRIGAMAFEADVPHVRVFVTAGGAVKQIIPEDPTNDESMTRGTLWFKKGKYVV